MLAKIARRPVTGDLQDLAQDVYLILSKYDEAKLQDLDAHNQMRFFVARILLNQYRSKNSPFHVNYRRPLQQSREIKDTDAITQWTRIKP